MADIKLAKLPDRIPVKLTIMIAPDLHEALQAYAVAYERAYGVAEPVNELIPAMLIAYLNGDRAFAKNRRGGAGDGN
jgi:hypothetical protein